MTIESVAKRATPEASTMTAERLSERIHRRMVGRVERMFVKYGYDDDKQVDFLATLLIAAIPHTSDPELTYTTLIDWFDADRADFLADEDDGNA
jgi:hypothetical protein